MSVDELIQTVYDRLKAQGDYAFENDKCRYRTRDGRKCAVGVLIPDDKYAARIEGGCVRDNISYMRRIGLGEHIEVLSQLQWMHDQGASCNQPFALMLADIADYAKTGERKRL